VDEVLFAAVGEQLRANQRRACIPLKGSRYLLQGLVVCARCGYAYCGRTNGSRNAYYRCCGSDASRFGGTRLCYNKEVRLDRLDAAVWDEVCRVLTEPERLEREYGQRLQPAKDAGEMCEIATHIGKVRRGIARLIDSYADGMIDKDECEPRIGRLRERLQHLERHAQDLGTLRHEDEELRLLLGRFEGFAKRVREGLTEANWGTRREIIRALVNRIEIDEEQVHIIFRVNPPLPPALPPDAPLWHYPGGRVRTCRFHHHQDVGRARDQHRGGGLGGL